jgi:hypothetical protein
MSTFRQALRSSLLSEPEVQNARLERRPGTGTFSSAVDSRPLR